MSAKRLTKAQVIAELAEHSELDKKSVSRLFDGLAELIKQELRKPNGEFVIPGLIKLRATHLAYGVGKRRGAAVMEVGRGLGNIAQAGHAHDLGLSGDERAKYPLPLDQIAANVHALMAGHAAERFEQSVAVLLLG